MTANCEMDVNKSAVSSRMNLFLKYLPDFTRYNLVDLLQEELRDTTPPQVKSRQDSLLRKGASLSWVLMLAEEGRFPSVA